MFSVNIFYLNLIFLAFWVAKVLINVLYSSFATIFFFN